MIGACWLVPRSSQQVPKCTFELISSGIRGEAAQPSCLGLPPNSWCAGNLDGLPQYLTLLVGSQKGDVRRVAAAADPDNSFNRRQSRRVDQPPVVFEEHLEDRVEVGRRQLKRIGADGTRGNAQCAGQ